MRGLENYFMAKEAICFPFLYLGSGERKGGKISVFKILQCFMKSPRFLLPLVKHQACGEHEQTDSQYS